MTTRLRGASLEQEPDVEEGVVELSVEEKYVDFCSMTKSTKSSPKK